MSETSRPGFLDILSPGARETVLKRGRVVRVRKGQAVLSRGVRSTDVFLVLNGHLQVVLYSADGREVTMRDLTTDQIFGELAAIDGAGRSASILAQSDARLLAIGQADFNLAISISPDGPAWLSRHLVGQIRTLTERIFELSALNVQARLHCELLRLARAASSQSGVTHIRPAPTHAALASRIGTHREAVTREMRVLVDRNIVRSGRRHLEFIDLPELEATVERSGGDASAEDA